MNRGFFSLVLVRGSRQIGIEGNDHMMMMTLPYLDLPPLQIGGLEWSWSMTAWSFAGLLFYASFVRKVEADSGRGRTASELFLFAFLGAAAGGLLASGWRGPQSSMAVLAGMASTFAYLALFQRKEGLENSIRLIDAGCAVAPFPFAFVRLGCVLEHAHPGVRSDSFLAVDYPGGPRWDLALLELLFFVVVGLLFRSSWIRAPWRPVALFGLFGLFRAGLEPLRIDFQGPSQAPLYLFSAAVAAAAFLWLHSRKTGRLAV